MAFNINGTTPAAFNVVINGLTDSVKRFDVLKDGITTTVWAAFTSQEFEYTGSVQPFTAPVTGTYLLEVWGAQGGNAGLAATDTYPNDKIYGTGGKGGYSSGKVQLNIGQTIYVVVGGKGTDAPLRLYNGENLPYFTYAGGYNGGGNGCTSSAYASNAGAAGGGATHIATSEGLLADLVDDNSNILIVAGGGGGGYARADTGLYGGSGGGTSGYDGEGNGGGTVGGKGGTQTSGYAFGVGQDAYNVDKLHETVANAEYGGAGAGAGYYGGFTSHGDGGGGGSAYIDNVTDGTTKNGERSGNGFAKISLVF